MQMHWSEQRYELRNPDGTLHSGWETYADAIQAGYMMLGLDTGWQVIDAHQVPMTFTREVTGAKP